MLWENNKFSLEIENTFGFALVKKVHINLIIINPTVLYTPLHLSSDIKHYIFLFSLLPFAAFLNYAFDFMLKDVTLMIAS